MSQQSVPQVIFRARPSKKGDGAVHPSHLVMDKRTKKVTAIKPDPSGRVGNQITFRSDGLYDASSTQEDIYNDMSWIVPKLLAGFSASILAYGVTGSGKTHTMQGTAALPGLIPRLVQDLFTRREESDMEITIEMSYIQVLNEKIGELLYDDIEPAKLTVRRNSDGQDIVGDLVKVPLKTYDEFEDLYHRGTMRRKTAATDLNATSSRGHLILMLEISCRDSETGTRYNSKVKLVDLAGQENNNQTGNDGERMEESKAINRSLETLGRVVEAIGNKSSRIPYRDSVLTRMLSDSLGGTSIGIIICCLAPGERNASLTYNTLKFANSTRAIRTNILSSVTLAATESVPLARQVIPRRNANPVIAGGLALVNERIARLAAQKRETTGGRPPLAAARSTNIVVHQPSASVAQAGPSKANAVLGPEGTPITSKNLGKYLDDWIVKRKWEETDTGGALQGVRGVAAPVMARLIDHLPTNSTTTAAIGYSAPGRSSLQKTSAPLASGKDHRMSVFEDGSRPTVPKANHDVSKRRKMSGSSLLRGVEYRL